MDTETWIAQFFMKEPLKVVLSNVVSSAEPYHKISIKPFQGGYQIEQFTATQAFHKNVDKAALIAYCMEQLGSHFRQFDGWTSDEEYHLRLSKKGKAMALIKPLNHQTAVKPAKKNKAILVEGTLIPPLVDMGIMDEHGTVYPTKRDKYRQINRYLEIIQDILEDETTLHVVDFGCGKSYLTFVVYYYLHELRGMDVTVTGVDRKADVIAFCQATAEKYGYNALNFVCGDIEDFQDTQVDMVISLHACDTASDYALFQAIQWQSKYILAVPCCQHEINQQLNKEPSGLLTRYGLIQERYASLLTDAMRANLCISQGYKTQILEFVDLTHTPKNVLLRAVRKPLSEATKTEALRQVRQACDEQHLRPTLMNLLNV